MEIARERVFRWRDDDVIPNQDWLWHMATPISTEAWGLKGELRSNASCVTLVRLGRVFRSGNPPWCVE